MLGYSRFFPIPAYYPYLPVEKLISETLRGWESAGISLLIADAGRGASEVLSQADLKVTEIARGQEEGRIGLLVFDKASGMEQGKIFLLVQETLQGKEFASLNATLTLQDILTGLENTQGGGETIKEVLRGKEHLILQVLLSCQDKADGKETRKISGSLILIQGPSQ